MHEVSTPKRKTKTARQSLQVGDRAIFRGTVLRVLPGDDKPLLLLIEGNGEKVVIKSHWFEAGDSLRGSDEATMSGVITRIGDAEISERTPVSIAVDGFTSSRVTLAAKWLSHE